MPQHAPILPGLSKLLTLPFCACRLSRLPVMCVMTLWFPPLNVDVDVGSELLGGLIPCHEFIRLVPNQLLWSSTPKWILWEMLPSSGC